MWDSMIALGPDAHQLNILGGIPVNGALGVSEALARIQQCLTRFDIFRVAYDRQQIHQTFQDRATVRVLLSDASDDAHPAAAAGVDTGAFDLAEAPIRLGLTHRDRIVEQVNVVLTHLAFDGAAMPLLLRHLSDALAGRMLSRLGPQTQDLLAYEQSDTGVRHSNAALDHWLDTAKRLPSGRGVMSFGPGRYSVTAIQSRAMAIAAQTLGRRSHTSAASVLLAALARVIHRHVAHKPSAMLLVSHNRMHPTLDEFVGQTIANGLLVVPDEVLDGDFVPYARQTHRRAVAAYASARYDCLRWRAIFTELTEKGQATDLTYFFNDTRGERNAWSGLERQIDELRRGWPGEMSIEVSERRQQGDATLVANIHDAGQECRLELVCDDDVITTADAAAWLADLETLLVAEATR
jgi:hypothetical protein